MIERRIGGLATQKEKDAKKPILNRDFSAHAPPPPETLEAFHDTHTVHLSTPLTLAEGRRSAQTGWTFQGFDRVTGKVAIRPCRRATQQKPWNTLEYGPPGAPRSTRSVWGSSNVKPLFPYIGNKEKRRRTSSCLQHCRLSQPEQTHRAPVSPSCFAGRLALQALQSHGFCGSLGLRDSLVNAACACCQLTRGYADISDPQFMQETGLPIAERCKVTERSVHSAACLSPRCLTL